MEEIRCLSCCEMLQQFAAEGELDKNIAKAMQKGGVTKCERIYFGSYFCGQYFIYMSQVQVESLVEYCRQKEIKLTLVIPILTEKNLEAGKEKIRLLSQYFDGVIDEVTVNDYGMLEYLDAAYRQKGKNIRLNIGRMLMKDYRDPRYKEYFNIPLKPRTFTSFLKRIIKQYEVEYLEFDPTHACIQFDEKPEEVKIAMHIPYCYETVGQICQMAAIDYPIEEKFRANEKCRQQCQKYQIDYFIEEGCTWIKHGKTVYFKNEECKAENAGDLRLIYSPLEWEESR